MTVKEIAYAGMVHLYLVACFAALVGLVAWALLSVSNGPQRECAPSEYRIDNNLNFM